MLGGPYGWSLRPSRLRRNKMMTNPPHPGRSIRENSLKPLGLNVTDAAEVLGAGRRP